MKRTTKLIAALALFSLLSSCKVYFNEATRQRIQANNTSDIERVQFYNDREIEIVYKTTSTDESISGGKVKFQDGYYYYTIKFPKKTPAIAEHLDSGRIKVFFESGEDRYLVFGKSDEDSPTSLYQLYGNSRDDGFYVNFEGKSMKVVRGSTAYLMMKKNVDVNVEEEKRRVKGVKVD